jgi:hypothetical protein
VILLRFKCHCSDSRGFVQQNSSLDTDTAIQCDQLCQNNEGEEDFGSDSGIDCCYILLY